MSQAHSSQQKDFSFQDNYLNNIIIFKQNFKAILHCFGRLTSGQPLPAQVRPGRGRLRQPPATLSQRSLSPDAPMHRLRHTPPVLPQGLSTKPDLQAFDSGFSPYQNYLKNKRSAIKMDSKLSPIIERQEQWVKDQKQKSLKRGQKPAIFGSREKHATPPGLKSRAKQSRTARKPKRAKLGARLSDVSLKQSLDAAKPHRLSLNKPDPENENQTEPDPGRFTSDNLRTLLSKRSIESRDHANRFNQVDTGTSKSVRKANQALRKSSGKSQPRSQSHPFLPNARGLFKTLQLGQAKPAPRQRQFQFRKMLKATRNKFVNKSLNKKFKRAKKSVFGKKPGFSGQKRLPRSAMTSRKVSFSRTTGKKDQSGHSRVKVLKQAGSTPDKAFQTDVGSSQAHLKAREDGHSDPNDHNDPSGSDGLFEKKLVKSSSMSKEVPAGQDEASFEFLRNELRARQGQIVQSDFSFKNDPPPSETNSEIFRRIAFDRAQFKSRKDGLKLKLRKRGKRTVFHKKSNTIANSNSLASKIDSKPNGGGVSKRLRPGGGPRRNWTARNLPGALEASKKMHNKRRTLKLANTGGKLGSRDKAKRHRTRSKEDQKPRLSFGGSEGLQNVAYQLIMKNIDAKIKQNQEIKYLKAD